MSFPCEIVRGFREVKRKNSGANKILFFENRVGIEDELELK